MALNSLTWEFDACAANANVILIIKTSLLCPGDSFWVRIYLFLYSVWKKVFAALLRNVKSALLASKHKTKHKLFLLLQLCSVTLAVVAVILPPPIAIPFSWKGSGQGARTYLGHKDLLCGHRRNYKTQWFRRALLTTKSTLLKWMEPLQPPPHCL